MIGKVTKNHNSADLVGYTQIPNALIRQPYLTPLEKAVAFYLISRSGKNRKCWPSMGTQCEELGVSDNTLRKIHNSLVAKDLITIRKQKGYKIYEISNNVQKSIDSAKRKKSTKTLEHLPSSIDCKQISRKHVTKQENGTRVPSKYYGPTSNDINYNLQEMRIKEDKEKEKKKKEEIRREKNEAHETDIGNILSGTDMSEISISGVVEYVATLTAEEKVAFDSLGQLTRRDGEPSPNGIKQKRELRKRALCLMKLAPNIELQKLLDIVKSKGLEAFLGSYSRDFGP